MNNSDLNAQVFEYKNQTVSQLVAELKKDVERKHSFVRVSGEISSFKQWRSGHCYFDIKDEQALIAGVMFKPHFAKLPFVVADGMQVLISGRISVYAPQTRLQLIAENMEPLGQGALALALEQLKTKLKAEGLFDNIHKKNIKTLNNCIGLITSSHGAVLRDMVRIIKSLNPLANILFMDTRVQGLGAKDLLASAIQTLDSTGMCDVIIVGRGGGSLEDLWPFNEEIVARAIFLASTPIISAVGHETDFSISDFVADVRAATPTHAAQIATLNIRDILEGLGVQKKQLHKQMSSRLKLYSLNIAQSKRRLLDPRIIIFRHAQNLDECAKILNYSLQKIIKINLLNIKNLKSKLNLHSPFIKLRSKQKLLFNIKTKLFAHSPAKNIAFNKNNKTIKNMRLQESIRSRLKTLRRDLTQAVTKLESLSPLAVLSRGFCLVEEFKTSRILTQVDQVNIDDKIKIRMQDGLVLAQIIK